MADKNKQLMWNCFNTAVGVEDMYRISPDREGGIWWRYGRNRGEYGTASSVDDAKKLCQKHHERNLAQLQRNKEI